MFLTEVEEPSVSNQKKDEDSPDQVMDVVAADCDPLEGTGLVDDGTDQEANSCEGEKEGDGGKKSAPAWPVRDGSADEEPNAGELHQHEQDDDDKGGEGQEYKGSGTGHNLL